ncbi:hypothetical protein HNR46_002755 [Haloferula luteola]|uniref:Legume lectin domain-containing protein n=1 Tax=Haloferula luteola TaxID=595692 RepID=A0A840VFA9_9BACT|nr:L-type lectin-domain containing protein [Haloferula luteola]MBB5352509.1 hypothetical protein [Haloferula luteola]
MSTQPLNLQRGLLAAAVGMMATSSVAHAAPTAFKYLRFEPVAVRTPGSIFQMSELLLFDENGDPIPTPPGGTVGVSAENPDTPAGELPEYAFDGNKTNKWLDFSWDDTALILDFTQINGGTDDSVIIGSYNYWTANDANGRDPVTWRLESSEDGVTWTLVDLVSDASVNTARNAQALATNREIPDSISPRILYFESDNLDYPGSTAVIPNGNWTFYCEWELGDTAEITVNGGTPIPVENGDYPEIALPDNSDSNVKLTVYGVGGTTAEKTMTIRTEDSTTRTVEMVRFSPMKMRAGTAIQLGEFLFFDPEGNEVIPVNVVDDAGTNAADANEGALKLIDGDSSTKWFSGSANPVVFEFSGPVELGSYQLVTANDFNGRDPIQWVLEESSDGGETWTYIESMTGLDYSTPTDRFTPTQVFPFPADGTMMPIIDLFTVDFGSVATVGTAGDTVDLDWIVFMGGTIDIQPQVGVVGSADGYAEVSVNETTTFVLTATAETGTRSVSAEVYAYLLTPFDGTIDYPGFDNADGVVPLGSSTVFNAYDVFVNDPDTNRLRLTDQGTQQSGTAWFFDPIDLSGGFKTTFEAEITHSLYYNGADGVAFIVQNSEFGNTYQPSAFTPADTEARTMAIFLDSYKNGDDDPSHASLKVAVNGVVIAQQDLSSTGLAIAKGFEGNYLLTGVGGNSGYTVEVFYYPGHLDVTVEGVLVIDGLAVDLGATGASVLDAEGKAYVGFTARTGGLGENHDILNWMLTTEGIEPPAAPLALTSYSFDFSVSPATVTLTWDSTAGDYYGITTSTTLGDWTSVMDNILATGVSTTMTVEVPAGTAGFFRVEETTAPEP